jgi:fructose-6-phosphate aldolase 2
MKALKADGIKTCGTVVYTPMQAFLAAKAGASFVAPYVNRIDNMGYDGVKVVKEIQDILVNNHMDCMVLAASFKNSQQVLELCAYGVGSATAAPAVIDSFVKNPAIDAAVQDFIRDFENATGKTVMTDF